MEKPIKFILLITLLGAGLSVMVMQKKTNDQLYTLQTCPYRSSFTALTKDACEVEIRGAIVYDPTEVMLDEAKMGDEVIKPFVKDVISKYPNDDILINNGGICDSLETIVNGYLHEYNSKLTWRLYHISGHKTDTLNLKIKIK